MRTNLKTRDRAAATIQTAKSTRSGFKVGGVFTVECHGADGKLKWKDEAPNLITTEGIYKLLDVGCTGATAVATWYVGLVSATPTIIAGNTLAVHAGWTEVTDYTGNRQEWVEARTLANVTNSASKAAFPITGPVTVGGAFLASASTGTSGTLLCAAVFTGGNKAVASGDTLSVQYDVSAADDGV